MPKANLPESLLQQEYQYIAQTAFQSNEDRARVSSFYLIAVGSVVAALFSTQVSDAKFDPRVLSLAFSGLFLILTVLGTLTTLQLARLRAAWYESARAMNQLKKYWVQKTGDKSLEGAFRWSATSLPAKYKVDSISYLQVLEVALLTALTFGACAFFLQKGLAYECPACNWAYTAASGALAFVLQLFLYKRYLEK